MSLLAERVLVITVLSADELNCGDYVSRGGKCYGPHTELVGWETAKATCQGENAQLVEVTDQAEQDILHGKLYTQWAQVHLNNIFLTLSAIVV